MWFVSHYPTATLVSRATQKWVWYAPVSTDSKARFSYLLIDWPWCCGRWEAGQRLGPLTSSYGSPVRFCTFVSFYCTRRSLQYASNSSHAGIFQSSKKIAFQHHRQTITTNHEQVCKAYHKSQSGQALCQDKKVQHSYNSKFCPTNWSAPKLLVNLQPKSLTKNKKIKKKLP